MAKEKKRNYEEKAKNEVLSEETRNALLGILFFLVAAIGLVETAGPIGRIIRYVFVYLLGTYSSLILVLLALLGVYVFVKRKFPKVKINITIGALLCLVFFSLIYSSKNDWVLSNVLNNYRDIFDSVSEAGYITIFSSSVAGGFIGHLLYSLINTLIGGIGTQIVCIVFMIGALIVLLQPVIYFAGNRLVNISSKVEQEHQKKKKDKEVRPNLLFSTDNEEMNVNFVNKKKNGYKFYEDKLEEREIETPKKRVINKEKSFDIFNDNYNFDNNKRVNDDKPSSFDIFNDSLFSNEENILREEKININNEVRNNFIYEDVNDDYKETSFSEEVNKVFENEETNNFFKEEIKDEPVYEEKEEVKPSSSFSFPFDKKEETFTNQNVYEERKTPSNPFMSETNVAPKVNNATPFIYNEEPKKEEVKETRTMPSFTKPKEMFNNSVKEEKVEEEVKEEVKQEKKIEKPFKNFQLPSLALLDEPQNFQEAENRANAERKGILLNKKLESLGIKARVVNYRISASFTRYELSLDPNSKITQFNNISQDLMMALSAEKVNVLAPIPGSEYIGVEIPNIVRSPVSLKETLVGTITYSTPPLLTAIGKDAIGEIISFDLAKTPHLLVAGSTGSGKSVCMNAIIMSLLMHNTPNDLRIILIDPKRVEFSAYANIPHLACPVITDVGKAGMALTRLVEFMNDRYKVLENIGAKNIEVYNKMMEKQGKDKMEFYVCIVDELADLFMNVKSAENSIKEITQLSRAVGIHMIVATQRPSVDVITGTIKNNIPSRIAFAVTTGADSRTILDTVGAENLLGRGDMLVNITGRLSMARGQGCNVTDDEIERVVDFIKRQGNPVFNPRFLDLEPPKPQQAEEMQATGTPEDDLVNEIIAYMSMGNHVSTTKIQTKFNIGYPRAARIIERLSEANIIYRDPQTKQWALNENTLDTDEDE